MVLYLYFWTLFINYCYSKTEDTQNKNTVDKYLEIMDTMIMRQLNEPNFYDRYTLKQNVGQFNTALQYTIDYFEDRVEEVYAIVKRIYARGKPKFLQKIIRYEKFRKDMNWNDYENSYFKNVIQRASYLWRQFINLYDTRKKDLKIRRRKIEQVVTKQKKINNKTTTILHYTNKTLTTLCFSLIVI